MKKIISILFFIAEGLLLLVAVFYAFGRIKITVIIYVCVGLAALLALLHLIYYLSYKKSKGAKTLRTVLISLLAVAFVSFAALEIFIISGAQTDKDPEADYLVVLGAGINGTAPSQILYDRLVAALNYLNTYPDAVAVVSGGQGPGEDITEAECMRRWLTDHGVAPERIIMEDKSTSTLENLTFSLEKIAADGGDTGGKIAIVSNEFHLYRAKFMAQALGAKPVGVAAKTSNSLLMINYFIREAPAVAVMWVS